MTTQTKLSQASNYDRETPEAAADSPTPGQGALPAISREPGTSIGREIAVALRMTIATLVLTGLAYPLALTGIAQVLFPHQANGSLVPRDGQIVGSELIAQGIKSPAYFQPRPSAAGDGYDPTSSSGSNLGPTSKKLQDRVMADIERLRTENPQAPGPVPGELVTASGSGLDPHLSPEAALWQAARIAAARRVPQADVEGRTFGLLGEPRVNVLYLNLDLDERFGKATP